MKRRLITLMAAIAAIAFNAGAQNIDVRTVSDSQILHALHRLTFGPRSGDIEVVRKLGLAKWIDLQLHPENIPENPALEERLRPLASLNMNLAESVENNSAGRMFVFGGASVALLQDLQKFGLNNQAVVSGVGIVAAANTTMMAGRSPERDLKDGKLYRALYSNRQLEEVLVDFWFNHFNVTFSKGSPFVADYEREAIRPYVLGKFEDMLAATALHPAMLQYLDNKASIAPEISQPNGPNTTFSFESARGLNENFSRELMELHTLGVDGGYTQKDIEAAARCFTGWSLRQTSANSTTKEPAKVVVSFTQWPHDPKDKIVLGHTIAGGGEDEVYELLDILASHPSTAHHISKQLAQRFVAENPPEALVGRMAKTFMETDGDLRAVMTSLLMSPEFLSGGVSPPKMKSPLELVASSLRAIDAETSDPAALEQWIADMGEPLYGKLEPTGYPNTGEGWFNTASFLTRLNFASNLAAGKISGITFDASRWNGKDTISIAREILSREPSTQTIDAIKNGSAAGDVTPSFIGGLILGSPDFQRK